MALILAGELEGIFTSETDSKEIGKTSKSSAQKLDYFYNVGWPVLSDAKCMMRYAKSKGIVEIFKIIVV